MEPTTSSSTLRIAIIGFGNFGQFLARYFTKQGHYVVGYSRAESAAVVASTIGADFFKATDSYGEGVRNLIEVKKPQVIILCTSIVSLESVLKELPLEDMKDALMVDVLSVKMHPKKLLLDLLPESADILCTHPMFGPESGKHSWEGLNMVYEKVRIQDVDRCDRFLKIFSDEGCRMVEMNCEEHDSYAASTQFVTHTTGRILDAVKVKNTPINTKGYEALLQVREVTCKDSFDLYYGIFRYNPKSKTELDRMENAFKELRRQLDEFEKNAKL